MAGKVISVAPPAIALATPPTSPAPAGTVDPDAMRPLTEADANVTDPDFDLSSTFDVPAFLRRQEG